MMVFGKYSGFLAVVFSFEFRMFILEWLPIKAIKNPIYPALFKLLFGGRGDGQCEVKMYCLS